MNELLWIRLLQNLSWGETPELTSSISPGCIVASRPPSVSEAPALVPGQSIHVGVVVRRSKTLGA